MEAYTYTPGLEATLTERRKADFIFSVQNSMLADLRTEILSSDEFYNDLEGLKSAAEKHPQEFLRGVIYDRTLLKKLVSQELNDEKQAKLNSFYGMEDIGSVLLEKRLIINHGELITFDYSNYSPTLQIVMEAYVKKQYPDQYEKAKQNGPTIPTFKDSVYEMAKRPDVQKQMGEAGKILAALDRIQLQDRSDDLEK